MQNRIKEIVTRFTVHAKSKKSAILALTDQGIVSLCNFLTIFFLARALPIETFGLFILVHTALLLLTSLQHASLTQAHNVLAARLEGSAYREFNSSVIVLQLSFSFIGVFLLFIAAYVFRQFQMEEVATGLAGLGIVLAPWLIRDLVRRVLFTQRQVSTNLLNDTISYGLQIAGIVALVQYPSSLEVRTIFIVLGTSSAISVGFGIIQLRSTLSFREFSMVSFRQRVSEIWGFSKWLSGGELLGWMGQYGHTLLIAAILGVGPVGSYRAALHLANILNPIELACTAYLPAKASRLYKRKGYFSLLSWLRNRSVVMGAAHLAVVLAIIAFARPLLDILYNGKFNSDALVIVLVLGVAGKSLRLFSKFFRIALIVIEKTYTVLIENAIAVVFVGTAGIWFIQSFGIVGAEIGRVILNIILLVYGYAMLSANHLSAGTVVLARPDGDAK